MQPTSAEFPAGQHNFKGLASNNLKHSNVLFSSHQLRLVVPRRLPLKTVEFPPSAHPGRRPVVPPTLETPTPLSRACSDHISSHFFLILPILSIFYLRFSILLNILQYTQRNSSAPTYYVHHYRLYTMYKWEGCICLSDSCGGVDWYLGPKAFRLKGRRG